MVLGFLVGLCFVILLLGGLILPFNHTYTSDGDYFLDNEDHPCETDCDADGPYGECTKCGWIDHLATATKSKETSIDS